MAKKEKKDNEIEENVYADHPLYIAVEEKRSKFNAVYNKYKIINAVVLVVMLALVVTTYILLINVNAWLAIGVVLVILIGTFVYTSFRKKKIDKLTDEYIDYFYNTTSAYVYNDVNYTDIVCHAQEKIDPNEFINAGFVTNVSHIGSRNCIYGTMSGLSFKSCDCVAKVTNNKVTEVAFLGEYYMIQLDNVLDGRLVVYMGPEANNGAGPNDLDGLDELKGIGLPENVRAWSNMKDAKKLLNKSVIDALSAFQPNKILEDVCISIKSNACYVALSYNDRLMVLPLLEKFDCEPQDQHKEDVAKLALVIKNLRKALLSKTKVDAKEKLEDKVEETNTVEAELIEEPVNNEDKKEAVVEETTDEKQK